MNTTGEILLYQPDETVKLEVRMDRETVWLNRRQLSILFGRDIKTIGKHIKNALHEELAGISGDCLKRAVSFFMLQTFQIEKN